MRVATVVACLAASSGAIAQTRADASASGRALLEKHCSRCHAVGIDGASTHAKAPPFRDVVKRYLPETLAEALAEGLVSGHPDMPEFAFPPGEVDAIVTYLDDLAARTRK